MAFIKIIKEPESVGLLKKLYESLGGLVEGSVANILRVHSLKPKTMKAHLGLYRTIMFGESTLTRAERETIAVVTSTINQCVYWVKHHGAALRGLTNQKEVDKAINFKDNYTGRELVMLSYVEKLTKSSYLIDSNDIKKLKEYFSDQTIFEINQITSYFNYVNRIASGLGVEIENEYLN